MPRKGRVPKRDVLPDPKYNSKLVAKFINCIMWEGKKSIAEGIIYGALDIIGKKTNEEPLKVFERAVENAKPVLEVRSRRVGGSTYQVPVEIRSERRQALALRWLIQYSRARGEKSMRERLAAEFLDAASNRGSTIKKKEDTHKMAEANKAFAHYKW
ncbi:MAG: 30S ribosomal protein S7 [Deltaproteobacteria bacterium]|nr:30S ribosomal protein S7 [Deltaproteobacteria bacterium]